MRKKSCNAELQERLRTCFPFSHMRKCPVLQKCCRVCCLKNLKPPKPCKQGIHLRTTIEVVLSCGISEATLIGQKKCPKAAQGVFLMTKTCSSAVPLVRFPSNIWDPNQNTCRKNTTSGLKTLGNMSAAHTSHANNCKLASVTGIAQAIFCSLQLRRKRKNVEI